MLFLKGPRWTKEKDGTGPAPLRAAAGGEPRRNTDGHGFWGAVVLDGAREKTEDTEGGLGGGGGVDFLNYG